MPLVRRELKESLVKEEFELLVIGGGSAGAGIALDAALRGYRVALIEAFDFASGSSSKSTKLFHGGVRYLEAAFKECDCRQLSLVRESLEERKTLLSIAPHLSHPLPIIIPFSGIFEKIYYGLGIKLYDLLAGKKGIGKSSFLSKNELLERLPALRREKVKGGILFYDGQFNDSRMNIAIVLKAIECGATALNYIEWKAFIKRGGKISAIAAKDRIGGDEFTIEAKLVVNATGPFADTLRLADDPSLKPALRGSSGAHLLLEGNYTPQKAGLLLPKTRDGRILFLLPWMGKTLVGTTDDPTEIRRDIEAGEEEIQYLIDHINGYLEKKVSKSDLTASFSGIRPLLSPSAHPSTKKILRDYAIEISGSRLYSIMGGKWTLYRKMAQELLDRAAARGDLVKRGACKTATTPLVEKIDCKELKAPLDSDIREHLAASYGKKAKAVAEIAKRGFNSRLVEGYPFIEAEVVYCIENELAITEEDLLYRRLQLGFIDSAACECASPHIKQKFFDNGSL